MSEQPLQSPSHEHAQASGVIEPLTEAVERIRQTVEFVPETEFENPEEELQINYHGFRQPDGTYSWNRLNGMPWGDDYVEVEPQTRTEDIAVFQIAGEQARTDDLLMKQLARAEGRWWVSSKAENIVETNLKEAFRIEEGEFHADILNCSNRELTETDKVSLEKVFNAVATYTNNKVFSRIQGIVLAPGSEFPDNVAGDMQMATKTLRINMDILDDKEELERYSSYFSPDSDVSWFELVVAHEIGHAFDISFAEEAERHGIKDDIRWSKPSDLSAFQRFEGWKYTELTDPEKPYWTGHQWEFENSEDIIECVPTDYGHKSPQEDFAESFAIKVMGGDMSKLGSREAKLDETVHFALGEESKPSSTLKVKKIEDAQKELIRPIKKVSTRVFISGAPSGNTTLQ